ncbi:MAG: SHOCT-like domain-containing protein [Bacteroidota bacterium]
MNEERLLILKMLEQGKISAEEAAALLEALEERDSEDFRNAAGDEVASRGVAQHDENVAGGAAQDKGAEGDKGQDQDAGESGTRGKVLGDRNDEDWDSRIEELGRKAEEWGREVEESVTRFAGRLQETIEQKLVPGLENLGDWVSTSRFRFLRQWQPGVLIDKQYRGRFAAQSAAPGTVGSDTLPILIQLVTRNGNIKITTTQEEEYILRIHGRIRPQSQASAGARATAAAEGWIDSLVEGAMSGAGIQLDLTGPQVVALHIELAVPTEHRYQIGLNSVNGSVAVLGHGLRSSTTAVETVNGGVSVKGLAAEYVRVATRNGGISLADLQTGRGEASTTNGGIAASINSLSGDWQLLTRNGGIAVNVLSVGRSPGRGKWRIRTTNGGITVVIPAAPLPPIFFRAQTRMGKVQVDAAQLVLRRTLREQGRHYVEGFLGTAADSAGVREDISAGVPAGAMAGQGAATGSPELQLELETTLGSITVRQE